MISAIVAVDRNYGIGYENYMPWPYLQHDMEHFKNLTKSHNVIMGRKTWDSLKIKPLPNRTNIVISHELMSDDVLIAKTPEQALEICTNRNSGHIFVIGGQSIYEYFLPLTKRFYITEIDQEYKCDRYFNFDYVKKHFKVMIELSKYTNPVPYSIKEYQL